MYTVLLSSCGLPTQGRYRLWFHDDTCPTGPDITYFGITTSDNTRLLPIVSTELDGQSTFAHWVPAWAS